MKPIIITTVLALFTVVASATPADSILTASLPDTLHCDHSWLFNGQEMGAPFILTWTDHVFCINNEQVWPYTYQDRPPAPAAEDSQAIVSLFIAADQAAKNSDSPMSEKLKVFRASPLVEEIDTWNNYPVIVFKNGHREVLMHDRVPLDLDPYETPLLIYRRMLNASANNKMLVLFNGVWQIISSTDAAYNQIEKARSGELVDGPLDRNCLNQIRGR